MLTSKTVVLPRATVTETVVSHLREEIISGSLGPGEPLPEARVAERLGISRAPVREALALLNREGLVSFDRRGTGQVCSFGRDDFQELVLMRIALEPAAARLAVERPEGVDPRELEANLRATKRAKRLSDVTRLDVEFHRLVLRASGNRRLLKAWEELAAQFLLVMSRFHRALQERTHLVRETTHQEHGRLVRGLKDGDPSRVEALARDHAAGWLRFLDELAGPEGPGEAAR